jgi:sterol 3beta-glucosyltransferase
MRVTILTLGSRGDVQPFLAFGSGLARAGHEVRLATHPRFEGLVAHVGLEFAPLAEGRLGAGRQTAEGRRWAERGSRRLPSWVGFLRDARSVAHQRLADAMAATEGADAIVASNLATVLGWQMSDRLNVPLMRANFNAPTWMSRSGARPAANVVRQVLWLAARPWLNAVRRDALGLRPVPFREPIGGLDRRRMPVLYPVSPAVVPRPAGWGEWVHMTGYWFLDRPVDPDPPPALCGFLAAGPPPVCVGFSTMIDRDPAATTEIVLEALRRAGRRAVLICGSDALHHALPPDVFAVDAVSHDWLFPRCAAVVHHAAAGATGAALRAGVPSVPVPHMTDQFVWARRLSELGVSPPPIPRRDLSVERLEEAIRIAVGQEAMRHRAAALGERIRAEDGVARAVEVFERHRAAGAPPPRRRRDRPVVLSNGLRVHGASRFDARYQHFIREYFQPGVEFRPGMTVLDVGANIGMFSLEVLRRCGGDVEVLAFEPATETFAHLERNVRELFPDAPVRLCRCALADRPGEATFYYRPRASGQSSLYREAPGGDPQSIDAALREPPPEYRGGPFQAWFRRLPRGVAEAVLGFGARWGAAEVVEIPCTVTTVSEALRDHAIERVDFLKVDVEGAELEVLRGIERDDWQKIRRLAVEVDDIDQRLQTILELLDTAGFDHVQVKQEWPFEGTNVRMVHAGHRVPIAAAPVA